MRALDSLPHRTTSSHGKVFVNAHAVFEDTPGIKAVIKAAVRNVLPYTHETFAVAYSAITHELGDGVIGRLRKWDMEDDGRVPTPSIKMRRIKIVSYLTRDTLHSLILNIIRILPPTIRTRLVTVIVTTCSHMPLHARVPHL